eukprot:s4372_g3.t1
MILEAHIVYCGRRKGCRVSPTVLAGEVGHGRVQHASKWLPHSWHVYIFLLDIKVAGLFTSCDSQSEDASEYRPWAQRAYFQRQKSTVESRSQSLRHLLPLYRFLQRSHWDQNPSGTFCEYTLADVSLGDPAAFLLSAVTTVLFSLSAPAMRGPTSLDICSLLLQKEQMQVVAPEGRWQREALVNEGSVHMCSKTSWSPISTCDGSPPNFRSTSWSSISTCDGLSDSSRSSEPDVAHPLLLRPAPGLPLPEWISLAVQGQFQAIPQMQVLPAHRLALYSEPRKVGARKKPAKESDFVVYFDGYDEEKHFDFDLVPRIIGKKVRKTWKSKDDVEDDEDDEDDGGSNANSKNSKGSSNMKPIYTLGKGIKIQVQGRGVDLGRDGSRGKGPKAQIGWPRGQEVHETHIYCVLEQHGMKSCRLFMVGLLLSRSFDFPHILVVL